MNDTEKILILSNKFNTVLLVLRGEIITCTTHKKGPRLKHKIRNVKPQLSVMDFFLLFIYLFLNLYELQQSKIKYKK